MKRQEGNINVYKLYLVILGACLEKPQSMKEIVQVCQENKLEMRTDEGYPLILNALTTGGFLVLDTIGCKYHPGRNVYDGIEQFKNLFMLADIGAFHKFEESFKDKISQEKVRS